MYSISRFCFIFSNLHNMLSPIENDRFWQIPTSFPIKTNQNGEIEIFANLQK
jgi:hypothetical protein